ncbi:unnamed protein product [Ectocarpus sp. 4 AP-2014]
MPSSNHSSGRGEAWKAPRPGDAQNVAQLLRRRREGKIPASTGGGVLGGSTSARATSAALRGIRGVGGRVGAGGVSMPRDFGFRRNLGQHPSMIQRLRHTATLRGHSGCVNRLCWNDAGTRIASGSDDTTVCLFDAASGERDVQFQTGHRRNILSVKFLPCTNDQMLVTGAMDGEVRLHKAPFSSPELTECFSCHDQRVHAVEVEPGNPFIFWSASEDGTVMQYDRRLPNAGLGEGKGWADSGQGSLAGRLRRRRNWGNCLIKLPSQADYAAGGGDSGQGGGVSQQQPQSGWEARGSRAFHLACNPVDVHYLAVACGDYVARVYDRRVLSTGYVDTSSGGGGGGDHGRQPPPALSFCPANEHPAAGKAASATSSSPSSSGRGGSARGGSVGTFGTARHATCVAFSPDGRGLLVSYHRDHVYLFDATGARRNSSAVSDPALSSYFMPTLPPPLPPHPTTPECSSNTGSGVGGRGDAGDEGRVARGRGFEEPADGILDAHRALLAWDGKGGPPVSLAKLSTLYRARSMNLRQRGWKGDGYMALLDSARAKELDPTKPRTRWEYVKALVHVGRRASARAEAVKCLAAFPDLQPLYEAEFSGGTEGESPPRSDLGGRNVGGRSASGGGGRGAGASREPVEDEDEKDEEEEEEEDEEEEEAEEGEEERGRERNQSMTPPREAGKTGRSFRGSTLADDLALTAELETARAWHEMLSRTGDVGSDPRCPDRATNTDCGREKGVGTAKGPAAEKDWTERECGQRSSDMLSCSPRAMIQRYTGACNVQTVIKEASFLGDGGGYVASGSDDGRVFIWESSSGRLVRAIKADDQIVNCVTPHPSLPVLATSGLESVVRLWSPRGEEEEVIGDDEAADSDPDSRSLEDIAQSNQGSMDSVGVNLGFQPLMHQLVLQLAAAENMGDDRGPGECVQA